MVGSRAILLSAALAPVPSHGPPAWQWPLRPPPRVVRGFSPPAHPWEAGHRGVDLAARPGRPVYAAGPGRVGFAGDLAGRGVVTIVHGALRTTYLPVRPAVHAGQAVHAGERIGVVAATPGHCLDQTCLHWGLLRGAVYLDPLGLLGLGPVRLLPWWPTAPGGTWPPAATPYAGRSGPVPPAPNAGPPDAGMPGPDQPSPDAPGPGAPGLNMPSPGPPMRDTSSGAVPLPEPPRAHAPPPDAAPAGPATSPAIPPAVSAWSGTGSRRRPGAPRRTEDPGRAGAGGPATPPARHGMRRAVTARLAGAATPAGAGLAGFLVSLGALTAFRPPRRAATLRRRLSRRRSFRR